MSTGSKIYVRYKSLGYVSNHIPVVSRYVERRKENIFFTCAGRAFHTYGCAHFTLLSVSPLHPEEIRCMAADRYRVFTAAGNVIYAWKRGAELCYEFKGHNHPVHLLLCFGPHLISVDEANILKVWTIKNRTVHLELELDKENFEITTMMHPITYLNKILIGSEQGSLQLWNLNSSKLIYTFQGWGSGVTAIEQSPAIDVVGIGLKNGHIIIHNLKFDEVVMEFHQDWGVVTSLSFRTDDHPILVTGTTQGHLVLWNLDERKVFSQLLRAHDGAVVGMKCLPSEPLMITSSPDNSLRLWIFDLPDGSARLLKLREGHSAPPSFIRFHGNNGHNLLSAGGDSCLRILNTQTEIFNKNLGKASYNRKLSKKRGRKVEDSLIMPPITQFAFETTQEKEWDNIAAIHLGIPHVTTWSYGKLKMGNLKLLHDRFMKHKKGKDEKKYVAVPTSIFVTHCGNFVLIGYSSGHCDRYNIQSGIYRASYGNPFAHDGAVRGVDTDMLNQFVITGGSDKNVKWWNFDQLANKNELTRLELDDGVSFFTSHGESSLTAVALEDFTIVIIDHEGRNIIRKFVGHKNRLTDATFSPNARWLVTASMDSSICTWDLPSGSLIDRFKIDAACSSLSFSPTGEVLATTHVDYLGVYLWTNRTLYNHVSLKPISIEDAIPMMELPSGFAESSQTINEEEEDEKEDEFESKSQIENLITLSNVASSRWQNLLNIDIVKKRNKPKEPPKAPKAAPFFLPTIPSMDVKFDFSNIETEKDDSVSKNNFDMLTHFGKLLKNAVVRSDFVKAFETLKNMGPASIDFEVNSLTSDLQNNNNNLLMQFMKMIKWVLKTQTDFELAQAYLALFLKIHGESIVENFNLVTFMNGLKECQQSSWKRIEDQLFYNLTVVKALKN